jgi:hypothetical protein
MISGICTVSTKSDVSEIFGAGDSDPGGRALGWWRTLSKPSTVVEDAGVV